MNKLNIVFAGTPEFAEKHLSALIKSNHNVRAVFTQSSKRSGRGLKFKHSPVRETAYENNIDIRQPEKITIKETDALSELNPDIVVVVAYGLILTKEFLSIPKYGCINVHPSLLPKFKGLNTFERILKKGEKKTGCTVHFVNEKLDAGKIILQKKIRIEKNENVKSLKKKVLKIEHEIYPKSILKILK